MSGQNTQESEIRSLLELSAGIGRDPLLVQASSGNTSVKLGPVLWIKASGKWLAHATEQEILLPVNLAEANQCVQQNIDPAGAYQNRSGNSLRASVETAMHAVLPHRIVIHVHSVNTIAWAVRRDGAEQLKDPLAGLAWQWMPYVDSGLPLAHAIERALLHDADTDVFVLGNHGLVVGGDDCESAKALLYEVEKRLAIIPRCAPQPDYAFLAQLTDALGWRLPENAAVHALGTDAISQSIVCSGVLYPCQAIFLTPQVRVLLRSVPLSRAIEGCYRRHRAAPFLIAKDSGVIVSETMSAAEYAMLFGLMHVVQRIDACIPIRYLTNAEVESLLTVDTYGYRTRADGERSRISF
jgi:rhamnose utilization protein RhaD (predicted bifunctional aldolase and dehydrogenase)